jgi:hypothetical protein
MKMKKILVLVLTLVVVFSISAFAEESETVSSMDAETYLELRLEQIEEALEAGTITEEEAVLLREHVQTVATEGTFGNRYAGEGNAECILGEGSNLGIFRSESAGQRTGSGNGVRSQKTNGTGNGNRGNGKGAGMGNFSGCIAE